MDPTPPAEDERFTGEDLRAAWPLLAGTDRLDGLRMLGARPEAEVFFLGLPPAEQADLVLRFPAAERRSDQKAVSRVFARHDLIAIPVVDAANRRT